MSPENADVLVGTGWLSENIGNPSVRIVEVDVNPKSYKTGHIPGAVLWNIYSDLRDSNYQLRDKEAFERTVATSGISKDDTIVFYGYGASLGFWLMKCHGHTRVRILNASKDTWQSDGHPLTTDVPTPRSTNYSLPNVDESIRADRPVVEGAIGQRGTTILDTRSPEEYRGERFWPSGGMEEGGRPGHIPSAVHLSAEGILDERGGFRSKEVLAERYRSLDLATGNEVIAYCTIGNRAAQTWFALTHILGHDRTRVYEGSWAEWGKMPDTPVES